MATASRLPVHFDLDLGGKHVKQQLGAVGIREFGSVDRKCLAFPPPFTNLQETGVVVCRWGDKFNQIQAL